jgi:hypothetical protein
MNSSCVIFAFAVGAGAGALGVIGTGGCFGSLTAASYPCRCA